MARRLRAAVVRPRSDGRPGGRESGTYLTQQMHPYRALAGSRPARAARAPLIEFSARRRCAAWARLVPGEPYACRRVSGPLSWIGRAMRWLGRTVRKTALT